MSIGLLQQHAWAALVLVAQAIFTFKHVKGARELLPALIAVIMALASVARHFALQNVM